MRRPTPLIWRPIKHEFLRYKKICGNDPGLYYQASTVNILHFMLGTNCLKENLTARVPKLEKFK